MIPGGYYIKARKAKRSWIAHAAPCIREVWDWLISEANHEDNGVCKRGQLLRSYADIQDGLRWYVGYRKMVYSKWDCERALKALAKERMIATTKTTRGLLITVCNYDTYQRPENYESHNESHNEATMRPQGTDTINKNERMKECKKNTPSSEAVRLADLLETLIRARKPDFCRRGNWARDIDLMLRLDKRTPEQVEAVIRWSQADQFWQRNIVGAAKLREKFDQLELNMQNKHERTYDTTRAKDSPPQRSEARRLFAEPDGQYEGVTISDD